MSQSEIENYQFCSFKQIKDLGSGSFARVKLLYHLKHKKKVVGKIFSIGGAETTQKKQICVAKREAEIHGRLKHKNIVKILGTTLWENRVFTLILEYVPNGDLETLLIGDRDTEIPWKIRARFFVEIANALNYLHNYNRTKPCIHGDLKPQNILLGDLLTIKVADFGAASFAKVTGATSHAIEGNTQHTPFYTAPEYLRNPTKLRCCSMDVYSFGMIGYEVITRERVYSGSQVADATLIELIVDRGQKPNIQSIDNVGDILVADSIDKAIFDKIKKVVYRCWQTNAENRPKISEVKRDLDLLAQREHIYDKVNDNEATALIIERKSLRHESLDLKPSNKITATKRWITTRTSYLHKTLGSKPKLPCVTPRLVIICALSILVLTIAAYFLQPMRHFLESQNFQNFSGVFLQINASTVSKFNLNNQSINIIFNYRPYDQKAPTVVPNVVKVKDTVYLISYSNTEDIVRVNLSDPKLTQKKTQWKNQYKSKKYLAFKDCIFAVGSQSDYMSESYIQNRKVMKSARAYLFNTTTGKWTRLKNMNEPRLGHALVLFQGLICAVGGSHKPTAECFNFTTGEWSYLPPMKKSKRCAVAVELNNELYVIGGVHTTDCESVVESLLDNLPSANLNLSQTSVEKYNHISKTWTNVAELKQSCINHSAGVFNGKIVVIGGFSNYIELYDPSENVWKHVSVLNSKTIHTRFMAIED